MVFVNSMDCILSSKYVITDLTKNDRYLIHSTTAQDYQGIKDHDKISSISESQNHAIHIFQDIKGKFIDLSGLIYLNHIIGIGSSEDILRIRHSRNIIEILCRSTLNGMIMNSSTIFITKWNRGNEFVHEIYITYSDGYPLDQLKYILSLVWNTIYDDRMNRDRDYIDTNTLTLNINQNQGVAANKDDLKDQADIEETDDESINDHNPIMDQNNYVALNEKSTAMDDFHPVNAINNHDDGSNHGNNSPIESHTYVNKNFINVKNDQADTSAISDIIPKQNIKDLDYIRNTLKINAF